jgi:hypothetical protein
VATLTHDVRVSYRDRVGRRSKPLRSPGLNPTSWTQVRSRLPRLVYLHGRLACRQAPVARLDRGENVAVDGCRGPSGCPFGRELGRTTSRGALAQQSSFTWRQLVRQADPRP